MAESQVLFLTCRDSLVRYFAGVVGSAETARDLAQDVFVRVLGASALPPTEAQQRAWLFHIARNLAVDHLRRERHRRADTLETEPPARAAAAVETGVIVKQALGALDDVGRDVFLMREAAGLSYTEIAEACGLSPDAVRSRIHRARVQLREFLQQPIRAARTRPLRAGFR